LINKDDVSTNSLDIWFGKNSDLRKTELLKWDLELSQKN
jgi:hypothetical protein